MRYEDVVIHAKACRTAGRKVVFKTGCFDIFHVGHLRALEFSAWYGAVFVGVGSDATVRTLKGPSRPVFDENLRAEVLGSLRAVEKAFVLTEPCIGRIDHAEALREIAPDYWVLPPNDKALEEKQRLAHILNIEIVLKGEMQGISSTGLMELMGNRYGS